MTQGVESGSGVRECRSERQEGAKHVLSEAEGNLAFANSEMLRRFTPQHDTELQVFAQITPFWIDGFDQGDLLRPKPTLDLFLASDSR